MPASAPSVIARWSAPIAKDRPLVVCLHGYSSNEHDLFAITDRLGQRPVFAAVRAPMPSATAYPGYAWFPLRFSANGAVLGGGPTAADHEAALALGADAAVAVDGLFAWLDALERQGDAPSSVGLVGFSQGGIVAAQALRMHPERISATVLFSSMVAPGALPGDATLAREKPPVLFGWGGLDPVIPPLATELSRMWLREHATLVEAPEPSLGHELSNEQLAIAARFLDEHLA